MVRAGSTGRPPAARADGAGSRPPAAGSRQAGPVRVLVVDDSHFVRRALTRLLASDPRVVVAGTAAGGAEALEQVTELAPDVVTLDVEMPGLDGIATLDALMLRRPTPVIMVSAHTAAGAQVTLRALVRGAVDFVAKPGGPVSMDLTALRDELIAKVLAAAGHRHGADGSGTVRAAARPHVVPSAGTGPAGAGRAVAIGASTGGVMALQATLAGLPRGLGVPIFIAQHMPPLFTAALAETLRESTGLPVYEAGDGEPVRPGRVYVAPGGRHLTVERPADRLARHERRADGSPRGGGRTGRGAEVRLRVSSEPASLVLRPSVNRLFASVAEVYGAGAVGVVLTGMGSDGTEGLAALKRAGGVGVVQDEATSVVYGMPGSAVRAGLADVVAPVGRIGEEIARALGFELREGGKR